MGIGFLKNVYNMQTSLVPYSSMGHAMPLPTQILQESDSLLSNRKGSSQDCHRPDGAQGLLTRGFRLKPAGKSELTCILSTWSQVSQSQNLNISIGNYADKTRNGLRITNAPGTPGDLQLWTLFERADRYTCPEVFEGDILALGTLGVSLIFFLFLGFLLFHFRVIFGVVHQENDGFLRFHRDRCPWRQLVVTQAQVHLQGIVKKLVAVGPSNKNG